MKLWIKHKYSLSEDKKTVYITF